MRHSGDAPLWKVYISADERRIVAGIPHSTAISEVKLAHAVGIVDAREANTGEVQQLNVSLDGWLDTDMFRQQGIGMVLDDSFAAHTECRSKEYHLADIVAVEGGDSCLHCGATLETVRGIEAGNIFKLGTQYSSPMRAEFTKQDGSLQPLIMGCYGIGITRMLACIIEDNHDDRGIVFPESIAPYRYHLVRIGADADVLKVAERIYNLLGTDHVLYDDRDVTAGVKFTDADLLGFPYRLTVSKKTLAAGSIEVKNRKTGVKRLLPLSEVETLGPAFTN
jgi:hypothetical protein